MVQLWDAVSGKRHAPPLWHRNSADMLTFRPDGKVLATSSHDGLIRLWRTDPVQVGGRLVLKKEKTLWPAFSPDGNLLATVNEEEGVQVWNAANLQPQGPPLRRKDVEGPLSFNADGTVLAIGLNDGIQLFEVAGWKTRGAKLVFAGASDLLFTADGKWLAAVSGNGGFCMWDWRTGKKHAASDEDGANIILFDLVISSDGRLLGARTTFAGMILWDTATGKLAGGDDPAKSLVLDMSSDGRRFAVLKEKFYILLAQSPEPKAAGIRLAMNVGSRTDRCAVKFSADGRLLATGFEDGTIRLWDAHTGKPHGQPLLIGQPVQELHFRPGTDQLAVVARDGTVRLLETATGMMLAAPIRHSGQFLKVQFSPDGKLLATTDLGVDGLGSMRLWALPQSSHSLEEMELRTWVALGVRLDANGVFEAISEPEWQGLRQKLAKVTKP